jgi:hypothetical protein
MTTTKFRTHYATYGEALADGWRRVDRSTDRDVSGPAPGGGSYFGYEYQAANGQLSHTITLSEERNKLGRKGCFVEMFRRDPSEEGK